MKYILTYTISACILFILTSCYAKKHALNNSPRYVEEVKGLLLITRTANFFIPIEHCEYLNKLDSNNCVEALIIDQIANLKTVIDSTHLGVHVEWLPNKDASCAIITLERCLHEFINHDELYIIPAFVRLRMFNKEINSLMFSYLLKFKCESHEYIINCKYKGSPVYCDVISIVDTTLRCFNNMALDNSNQ